MARAMMKVQMEHALARLGEASDQILGEMPKRKGSLKDQQRADLVRTGVVKVTPAMVKRAISRHERSIRREGRYCDSIERCLEYELGEMIDSKYKPAPDPAMAKWEARRAKLRVKFNEAKDEIILGDVDRALKLIEEFRKIKV